MARQQKLTTHDLLRLDAIAENLKVKARYQDASFTSEVITACIGSIDPIVRKLLPCTGEEIAFTLGQHLGVKFEEVRCSNDIDQLEEHYLKGKKEIAFARLREELRPGTDALLFQRLHARHDETDRWVAVLNLMESDARAYWNRFHEIAHRIAEPPQKFLPLKRFQNEARSPIEELIDAVAAELAFYRPAFLPLLQRYRRQEQTLNFEIVNEVRQMYAPSASLLATVKAVVKHWHAPAVALTAEYRGRVNSPNKSIGLRITPQAYSESASAVGLTLFPNMRIPIASPINETFSTGIDQNASEFLGSWGTSQGKCLEPINVNTSACRVGDRAYAIISL